MTDKPAVETAYRNDEPILEARLGPLLVKRDEAREDITDILSIIHRRKARILAGRCGLAGGLVTTLVAIGQIFVARTSWTPSGYLTLLLLGSAALAVVVYGIAAADPLGRVGQKLVGFLTRGGDLRSDVERLTSDRDVWSLREEALALEKKSVFLPLGAAAVLMPLVLHFFCGIALSLLTHSGDYLTSYDAWIVLSIGLVGAAHLSLLYRVGRFADLLQRTPDDALSTRSLQYGWRTLGWVTLYACLPGAIFWLLPVLVAALTGVLIVPVIFLRAGKLIARERANIGLAPVADQAPALAG